MGQQKLLGGHNGYYDPENYNCGRRKALRLIAGEQLGDVEQALAEAKNGAPILRKFYLPGRTVMALVSGDGSSPFSFE